LKLEPDSVYMASVFADFVHTVVLVSRGISLKPPFTYDAVSMTKCLFIRLPAAVA